MNKRSEFTFEGKSGHIINPEGFAVAYCHVTEWGYELVGLLNGYAAAESRLAEAAKHLQLVIQCFDDLESDVATHNAAYESFPMATQAIANAREFLAKIQDTAKEGE